MNELHQFVSHVVGALDRCSIPYMLVGSAASSFHGEPRSTRDVDLVVRLGRAQISALAAEFPEPDFYFDEDLAREAVARGSQFNVIDSRSLWKADLVIARGEFTNVEMRRRIKGSFAGVDVYLASAEDTVLSKLGWARASGTSHRQLEDCAGVLRIKGADLDRAYIAEWVRALGLESQWAELCRLTDPR